MGSTHAVVIAIENYQQTGIDAVDFAAADAKATRQVLIEQFGVPEGNISLWIDQDATQARLHNDLTYTIRQLGPEDRFVFFYAGHGFFANGSNRLTTWDSHPSNLQGTTTCLDEVLLSPLRKSSCLSSLVFVDACAESLKRNADASRDILTDMTPQEFEDLVQSSDHSAVFFSCSPHEKSYSSESLGHGIWTYHLLRALRGEAKSAIQRDRWVTGDSLKDYLSVIVPQFIRERTSIRGQQRPYAILGSNGSFGVVRIPEPVVADTALPNVTLNFSECSFEGVQTRAFARLEGFDRKRGHSVPSVTSARAAAWGQKLLHPEIVAELESTKDNAKNILQLGRRDVSVAVDGEGGGSVDTDQFRFTISTDQSSDEPSSMLVTRKLMLRVLVDNLPSDFDDIFVGRVDEMVIPVSFDARHYDDIADAMEAFAKKNGATFNEVSSEGLITVGFPHPGPKIVFDSGQEKMRISGPGARGCLALVRLLKANTVNLLLGTNSSRLGSGQPRLDK